MSNIEKLARYIGTKENPDKITEMYLVLMKNGVNKKEPLPDWHRKTAQMK